MVRKTQGKCSPHRVASRKAFQLFTNWHTRRHNRFEAIGQKLQLGHDLVALDASADAFKTTGTIDRFELSTEQFPLTLIANAVLPLGLFFVVVNTNAANVLSRCIT